MSRCRRHHDMSLPLTMLLLALSVAVWGCGSGDSPNHASSSSEADSSHSARRPHVAEPLKESIVEPAKAYTARLSTECGDIIVALLADDSPYTVSNFIHLANLGFYDGLTFHKVIPGFVIQAGDPAGTGEGGPGYVFADEANSETHLRGVVSMANQGLPGTNGSQFFICLADLPMLDGRHTIFGRVTEGMEIVDQLESGDRITRIEINTE